MSTIPKPLQDFLNVVNTKEPTYSPTEAREQLEKITEAFALPKTELPLVQDRIFYSNGYKLPARVYHPKPDTDLPLMFYFHGGGHVCGSLKSHDAICRRIAQTSQCVVLAIAYRLAPEFPYPAGVNDCKAIFEQSESFLNDIHVNTHQVFIAGDSAGGNLALTVAHDMKIKGDERIKGLALIYPSVDFSMQHASIERNGKGYLLTKEKIASYFNLYFTNDNDRVKASPINFQHLKKLPPIYMAVAEYDPLHDEGVAFAKKSVALGVSVNLEEFAGMVHAFLQLEQLVPEQITRLFNSIADFTIKLLR